MSAVSAVANSPGPLTIALRTEQSVVVLTVAGVLAGANTEALRDGIVKATLAKPAAVIVDINGLRVPTESDWLVLLGARWQDGARPDVPILLVCASRTRRDAIARTGVVRFMPAYTNEKGAKKALARLTLRDVRHAQARLPASLTSLRESRRLVREWLTAWSYPGFIPVALVVVNVFLENVLKHTGSDPVVRVECDGATATVAVSDGAGAPAARLPSPPKGTDVSGLAIVSALSRDWGSTPTSSGKTVWAVIGPENQL
ncbi:STAS domain-containing protein [Mycobacterium sp.]|uniref:STAS domain-containing protein n=1 Tax=Mycobacterium sp. TaxID=1785 RepID=UPI0025FF4267|nr:STAS domain-containing protein [Mycobacterium sp.]